MVCALKMAALCFLAGELVALMLFPVISARLGPEPEARFRLEWNAVMRGALERLVLFVALVLAYPQMLIAFGAMKLGTRLHDDAGSEISNHYFLVGNFTSILFVLAEVGLFRALTSPV